MVVLKLYIRFWRNIRCRVRPHCAVNDIQRGEQYELVQICQLIADFVHAGSGQFDFENGFILANDHKHNHLCRFLA